MSKFSRRALLLAAAVVPSIAMADGFLPSWQESNGFVSGSKPPTPPPAGWPDATNTGPRTSPLTPSGSITTTSNGQTISGLDVTGVITVAHDNVTVTDCKIHSGLYGVDCRTNNKLAMVQYCEIYNCFTAINGSGTFSFNNLHDMENGVSCGAGGSTILSNYIHDFNYAVGTPHYDGVEMNGLQTASLIKGNNIINLQGQTSCININNFDGASSNIVVQANRLVGGSYPVYFDGNQGVGLLTGMQAIFNTFVKGGFGFIAINNNIPLVQGNTREDTGAYIAGQTFYAPGSPAFTPSAALNSTDANIDISFRERATMSVASPGKVYLVYQAHPTKPLLSTHVSIAKAGTTSAATTVPVEVTFNKGGHGFTLDAGEYIVSDLIDHAATFSLAINDVAMPILDVPNVAGQGQTLGTGNSNVTSYFQSSVQSWNQQAPGGTWTASANNNFSLVQIRIP